MFEDEFNTRDIGLAALTGTVLGGSVGARQIAANESFGAAFAQVGAGAGFNALATGLGSSNPGDLYIAAAVGGAAVPATGYFEDRFRKKEAFVNTLVGSTANTLQYSATQFYNGKSLQKDEFVGSLLSGLGPGGVKAAINYRGRRIKGDDFLVAGGSALSGGIVIPWELEGIQQWINGDN